MNIYFRMLPHKASPRIFAISTKTKQGISIYTKASDLHGDYGISDWHLHEMKPTFAVRISREEAQNLVGRALFRKAIKTVD